MDFWQKARSFAEGAAKRSQELTTEAAKGIGSMTTEAAKGIGSTTFSDVVSEASKRSKEIAAEASKRSREIAAEASKRADQIKIEAIKRADQIKSQIPAAALSHLVDTSTASSIDTVPTAEDLVKYGVTEELMEFVKGITINTFKDFPLEDDSEMSDVPTESNVRRDLTEWQERHAKLVLSTVKEISRLRYELCPRWMKERKFWRIYFILVNSHVAPCEKRYMEEAKQKSEEKKIQENVEKEGSSVKDVTKTKVEGSNEKSKSGNKSASEQDLDVFLLGDTGDSDGVPGDDDNDDNDDGFDDDEFDKL